MEPEDLIKKSELVSKIYGRWPSFHDFEITRVEFDRRVSEDASGPNISAFIHMWQITGKTDHGKKFVFGNHNIVELRMENVYDYDLAGFNCQNVIDDIEVWKEKRGDSLTSCIHFPAIFGADLMVMCEKIEIGRIEPGLPADSVYGGA
ncbi:MAG: Imm50 family immunity protein [Planctomycetota bacterium]|jgi:hypothetical protein